MLKYEKIFSRFLDFFLLSPISSFNLFDMLLISSLIWTTIFPIMYGFGLRVDGRLGHF